MTALPPSWSRTHGVRGQIRIQPAADTRRARRPAPTTRWRGAVPRETRQRDDATTGSLNATTPQQLR